MKPVIFLYKLILIFENVKFLISHCSRDTPFLKNGQCLEKCTTDEIDSNICILDNEIIKTQNLTNIIQVGDPNYHYINLITTENGDLICSASSFPNNTYRIFFGLTKEGKGYFYKDNKRAEFYKMTLNNGSNEGRYEFELFPVKLYDSYTDNNEYIMSMSKSNQYLELYDLKHTQGYYVDLINTFEIYNMHQEVGTILKLNNNNNNVYIIGVLGTEYFCSISNCNYIFCSYDLDQYTISYFYFIKIQFPYLNINQNKPKFSKTKVGNPSNIHNPEYMSCCDQNCIKQQYSDIDVSSSKIISCYETTKYYIVCFYQKKTNFYTITVYSESLIFQLEMDLYLGVSNDYTFFKCIHYFGETGIFSYFSNGTDSEIIFRFIDFSSSTKKIVDHFEKTKYLKFGNNLFEKSFKFNDITKINDKKFYYVSASTNKESLYITSINNYYEEQFMIRIYKIGVLHFYNYALSMSLRITNYNNFLSLGSGYNTEKGTCSSLIIFSYPNSTDINMDVLDTLLNNNDIKINNITFDLKCKIENNIFGLINIGIQIKHNCINDHMHLTSISNTPIESNYFLNGSDFYQLNLIISKNKIYYSFNCEITYNCIATEPNIAIFNNYSTEMIDNGEEGNKEDKYIDAQKTNYTGRYSDFNISLVKDLTEENCEQNCELCVLNKKDQCLTCKSDYFNITDNYKLCFDHTDEKEKEREKEKEKEEENKENKEKVKEEEREEEKEKKYESKKEEEKEIERKEIKEKNEKEKENIEEEHFSEKNKKEIIYEEEDDKSDNISNKLEREIRKEEKEEKEEKKVEEEKIENKIDDVIEVKEDKEKLIEKEKTFEEKEKEEIGGINMEDKTYNHTHEEVFDECSLEGIKLNLCNKRISEEKIKLVYQYFNEELINDNYKAENILIRTLNAKFHLSLLGIQQNLDNFLVSNIDLGDCENEIKRKNNISSSKQLIIFKLDLKTDDNSKTFVYYEIYNPDTLKRINIQEDCKDILIDIYTPVILDDETLFLYSNLSLYGYNLFDEKGPFYNNICTIYTTQKGSDILLIDRKKDIFNTSGNLALCQQNCELVLYDQLSSKAKCICEVQSNDININLIKNIKNIKFNKKEIKGSFFEALSHSNFRVMKCYKIPIDLKHFFRNTGRAIITFILIALIILIILYSLNGRRIIRRYFKFILKNKYKLKSILKNKSNKSKHKHKHSSRNKRRNKNNNKSKHHHHHHHHHKKEKLKEKKESNEQNKEKEKNSNVNEQKLNNLKNSSNEVEISNPPKNQSLLNSQDIILNKDTSNIISPKNAENKDKILEPKTSFVYLDEKFRFTLLKNRTIILNDEELNTLEYQKAVNLDKRNYCQYYWSLLKSKQLILFTFFKSDDYNLKIIKICLLLLSFSLYFTINGFFFIDDTIHKVYIDNGIYKILFQLPIMIYSTLVSAVINFLLKKLSLTGQQILELKQEKDFAKAKKKSKELYKCISIKLAIFFSMSFIFMLFFWYFISCFCGVYINTQRILIIDTLISFCLSMIYPFGLSLFPGFFRVPALRAEKRDKEVMYKIGCIIAYI